jgi:hypothetical protein
MDFVRDTFFPFILSVLPACRRVAARQQHAQYLHALTACKVHSKLPPSTFFVSCRFRGKPLAQTWPIAKLVQFPNYWPMGEPHCPRFRNCSHGEGKAPRNRKAVAVGTPPAASNISAAGPVRKMSERAAKKPAAACFEFPASFSAACPLYQVHFYVSSFSFQKPRQPARRVAPAASAAAAAAAAVSHVAESSEADRQLQKRNVTPVAAAMDEFCKYCRGNFPRKRVTKKKGGRGPSLAGRGRTTDSIISGWNRREAKPSIRVVMIDHRERKRSAKYK